MVMEKSELKKWILEFKNSDYYTIDDVVNIILEIDNRKHEMMEKYYDYLNGIYEQDSIDIDNMVNTEQLSIDEIKEKYKKIK